MVVAGILLFLNELYPTKDDIEQWKRETKDHLTDIPCNGQWRQASDIPDEEKLKRAIYVTAVTPKSQQTALKEFDAVVREIETCREMEIANHALFAAWKGDPEDRTTCVACDEKTFCPEAKNRYSFPAPVGPVFRKT